MTEPTIQFEELVFGGEVPLDDPAESYHEASRLYVETAAAQLPGVLLLSLDPHARAGTERSSRRHPHREGTRLPRRALPPVALADALERRVSEPPGGRRPLSQSALAAILGAAYACRSTPRGVRRPVPSAGALYPLELYALCPAVAGLSAGVRHYDPFSHRLELLDGADRLPDLAQALSDPGLLDGAAVVLVVTAVFWRSRFKYGQRGYRFALLEAGHVAQNVLLACAALRLPALPVGGFYDRRVDAVVGADSVHESTLYLLVVGGSRV